jgi:hypothetical protein
MYTVWPCATPVWRIDPTNKTRHGGRAPIHPPSTPYPTGVMYGAGIDQYVLLDRVMIPLDRPPGRGSGIPAAMAAGARSWYRTGRQKLPRASAAIIVRVVKRRGVKPPIRGAGHVRAHREPMAMAVRAAPPCWQDPASGAGWLAE